MKKIVLGQTIGMLAPVPFGFSSLMWGITATILGLFSITVNGAVIDQEFDAENGLGNPFFFAITGDNGQPFSGDIGQSFTVGLDGELTRIDLQIIRGTSDLFPIVDVTVVEGTTGIIVGSSTLNWADLPTRGIGDLPFFTVIDNLSVSVGIGDVYSVFLSVDPLVNTSNYPALWLQRFIDQPDDPYTGGSILIGDGTPPGFGQNVDGGFRTFVATVPRCVQTFNDVPLNHWAFSFIETLAESCITVGCGNDNYCPDESVTRAQMAVFIERGMRGSSFSPPMARGNIFLDVDENDFAASFIEQFFLDFITAGCGSNNYCPADSVTRAQMAVFLLRAIHGPSYIPPPPTGVFGDVDLANWAVSWIEQLAAEGITAGCGGGNYCPDAVVTRDQMAVFLVRTFGL